MILDGYNVHGTVRDGDDVLRIVYRPMLSHERRQFLVACRGWDDESAIPIKWAWLQRHIVVSETALLGPSLLRARPDLFEKLHHVLCGVAADDRHRDLWSKDWEREDVENLRDGVRLARNFPFLDRRSCKDCLAFEYWEHTGERAQLNGKWLPRTSDLLPLCQLQDGCPVGTPEKQTGRLSPKNRMAFHHFRLCDAVGQFPDDPIVRRNALVIRAALKEPRRGLDGSTGGRGGDQVARNGRARGNAAVNEFAIFGDG